MSCHSDEKLAGMDRWYNRAIAVIMERMEGFGNWLALEKSGEGD